MRALDSVFGRCALTERMSATAHAVSPELGAAFDQNDNSWKVQSARKENPQSLTGDLNPTRSGFDDLPGGKQVAKDISKVVAGEGKKAETLTNLETGFNDDQPVRSAVAETIATRGRPQDAKDTQSFDRRLSARACRSRVDPDILNWVEQKAGAGGAAKTGDSGGGRRGHQRAARAERAEHGDRQDCWGSALRRGERGCVRACGPGADAASSVADQHLP